MGSIYLATLRNPALVASYCLPKELSEFAKNFKSR
jgi:hypothetical protein